MHTVIIDISILSLFVLGVMLSDLFEASLEHDRTTGIMTNVINTQK